jgi:hypothetical protein
MTFQDSATASQADPASKSPSLTQDVASLSRELRELAHDQLELATLETRLSIRSLLAMAVIAIVAALLLVTAWLALVGAAALGLIHAGFSPVLTMLLLAAASVLLAFGGWLLIRRKSGKLGWPATLRTLKPRPPAARESSPA